MPISRASAEPARTDPRPIRAVVLVDESGSLSPEGVAVEKEAAAVIAQSEFSPESQVAVVGFGSTTGRPNQSAVDVVCDMTKVADGPSRDALAGCVEKLHARTPEEGDDTDFAKALGQAMSMLGTTGDQQKVVFLLTDGRLDVSNSPEYGGEPSQRNSAALSLIDGYLATARKAGVQVWPLGFGPDPDQAQLDKFAAGGSQTTCGAGAAAPRARLVRTASDVVPSLLDVFASARCASHSDPQTTQLGSGRTVELTVKVPVITTDGSIAVTKRDKRISVQYFDPQGHQVPKSGQAGETAFQVSGENSPVEVLRIVNPMPGDWKVRITSGPEVPPQDVSATVVWQGVVNSVVSIDPPQPRAGQPVTVKVHIRTRNNAVTDPDALKTLQVRAQLSGDGFTTVEVPLTDDGKNADGKQNDGEFTGQVTVPTTATGPLRLVGSVGGPGIDVDQRPLDTKLADPNRAVNAQLRLDRPTVAPGESLTGTVVMTNTGGARPKLRLVLDEFDKGTLATVSPATLEAPASGGGQSDFKITFDKASQVGAAQARLRVVDDADPTLVYADAVYTFDVQYPPTVVRRLWWLWLAVLALLAVLAGLLLVRRAGRRKTICVHGLSVQLLREGRQVASLSAAEDRWAGEFGFVIRGEDTIAPMLVHAPAEPGHYVVRRNPQGGVTVQPPSGPQLVLEPGRPKPLPNGWDLGFQDRRAQGEEPDDGDYPPTPTFVSGAPHDDLL